MREALRPRTTNEVAEILGGASTPVTTGYGPDCFVPPCDGRLHMDLSELTGIVDYSPKDQVVTVRSGTRVNHLSKESKLDMGLNDYVPREPSINEVLAEEGQCLPFLQTPGVNRSLEKELLLTESHVGFVCGYGLPHLRENWHGSWRDWILGAKAVLADGTVFKSGSQVVKSVAGYELHRMLVGSCDTLAIVVELTLRTVPIESVWQPAPLLGPVTAALREEIAIQRVLRSDFSAAVESVSEHLALADPGTCTLWVKLSEGMELKRFPHDWIRVRSPFRPEFGVDAAQSHFMRRAKQVFDPEERLNLGAMVVV